MDIKTTIVPRYAETDKMGIIHHSVYPVWYEVGRSEFCDEIGMPFHEIEKLGLALAVTNVNVDYKFPALYGDKLTLITKVKDCGKVRIVFEYKLYNQNNILINCGTTSHAWLNKDLRPVNITKINEHIYNLILKTL